VTFPHVGTYAYDCLVHSGIPGNADMDGVVKVIPRPHAVTHVWTVWAGTGSATDENGASFPPRLTIRVGDSVTWMAGGEHAHTVTFGLDPRKVLLEIQVGKDAHDCPILAENPLVANTILPKGGIWSWRALRTCWTRRPPRRGGQQRGGGYDSREGRQGTGDRG
jgi:plastocyanin